MKVHESISLLEQIESTQFKSFNEASLTKLDNFIRLDIPTLTIYERFYRLCIFDPKSDHTESSVSRDRDSDDDWEAKEASRTHSVKFTEDMPEIKEVSLCCFGKRIRQHACSTSINKRYNICIGCHNGGAAVRKKGRDVGNWFRNARFSGHRAYLALSSIIVAME